MQEAELTRKLVLSVDKMKSAPALSQTMQVLRMFRSFANGYGDSKFRLMLNQVIEHFVEGEAKNGYLPYQLEYGPAETPEPELPETDLQLPSDEEEKMSEAAQKNAAEIRSQHASHATSDGHSAPEKVGSNSEVCQATSPQMNSTPPPDFPKPASTITHSRPRKDIGRLAAFRK